MSKLKKFVFQDTGIEVRIKKVSPLLIADARSRFLKEKGPKPPINKVNYGTPEQPDWKEEPNTADPDYIKAKETFESEVDEHIRRFIIRRGVECEVDLEAVKEVRDDSREEFGIELDPDDKVVYVSYVCTGTQDDVEELLSAIVRRSQPTEEDIAQAAESFRR